VTTAHFRDCIRIHCSRLAEELEAIRLDQCPRQIENDHLLRPQCSCSLESDIDEKLRARCLLLRKLRVSRTAMETRILQLTIFLQAYT